MSQISGMGASQPLPSQRGGATSQNAQIATLSSQIAQLMKKDPLTVADQEQLQIDVNQLYSIAKTTHNPCVEFELNSLSAMMGGKSIEQLAHDPAAFVAASKNMRGQMWHELSTVFAAVGQHPDNPAQVVGAVGPGLLSMLESWAQKGALPEGDDKFVDAAVSQLKGLKELADQSNNPRLVDIFDNSGLKTLMNAKNPASVLDDETVQTGMLQAGTALRSLG